MGVARPAAGSRRPGRSRFAVGVGLLGLSAVAAATALLPSGAAAAAERKDPLVARHGGAEVDWARGLVTVHAGAAADLRLPGPEAARPAAERQAHARAAALLRAALEKLPVGHGKAGVRPAAALDAAVARAKRLRVEYQSNGGVLLDLGVRFADLVAAPPAPRKARMEGPVSVAATIYEHEDGDDDDEPAELVLSVAKMPFEIAPVVLAGKREVPVAFAVYRAGAPAAGVKAIAARRDKQGRLILPESALKSGEPARAAKLVVYVKSLDR